MNIAKFAQEFTQLVIRWTTPVTPNHENNNNRACLTKEQVTSTVHQVLHTILHDNALSSDNKSVRTPATGIAIITPDAPVVPKIKHSEINGIFERHSNKFINDTSNNFEFPVVDISNIKQEYMDTTECNITDDKKVTNDSQAAPEVHISTIGRSDTFTRDSNDTLDTKSEKKKLEEIEDTFTRIDDDFLLDTEKMSSGLFLQKLEALRKSAFDVVSKIDEVKKQAFPQKTKPIRRLSSIGMFPDLCRSTQKPISAVKMRRSFTAFPGTPTSSRLNTTIIKSKQESVAKRKCTSTFSLNNSPSLVSLTPSTNRAPIGLSLVPPKKSPISGGRPAKNPKYAHVQSTIPKPVLVGKRKAT